GVPALAPVGLAPLKLSCPEFNEPDPPKSLAGLLIQGVGFREFSPCGRHWETPRDTCDNLCQTGGAGTADSPSGRVFDVDNVGATFDGRLDFGGVGDTHEKPRWPCAGRCIEGEQAVHTCYQLFHIAWWH